jgi:hypothetical protein
MKKALTILLIPIFILTATVGVTLTSYSCKGMEEKAMIKPCCKNMGKGGCCEKETIVLKIQDAFIKAANNSSLSSSLYFIHEQIFSFSFAPRTSELSFSKGQWDNAPPSPNIGFYILYRSLII